MHRSIILMIGLTSYLSIVNTENILVAMPLPARSHFKSFQPLLEELVIRGHNLTIISIEKLSDSLEGNYTFIDVNHLRFKLSFKFADLRKQSRLYNWIFSSERVAEINEWVLQETSVQQLLTNKDNKFDLVVMELFYMDVFVALGHHFEAPVVAVSAQNMISVYSWITGDSMSPSYIPNTFLPLTDTMSFWERFLNTMFTVTICLYHEFISLPKHQRQMETYFPLEDRHDVPKIKDMMRNISLVLVNAHFTFGYPKPLLPNFIQVAGLHITKPTPLPKNIQEFMDDASEGVIYVSLGSLIQPKDIEAMGTVLINALRKLPQKVIFKWNPKLFPSIPNNFLVQQWLPQIDILRHSNCHLFITHGGLHSLLESVKYSVPLIGIPFFTDQQHNIALIEHFGMGKGLHPDLNEAELIDTVKEVLSNYTYYANMKLQSDKFNDRIVPPLNTAVYWIEYVLRQKDSLSYTRPSSTGLTWYQYLLLDVSLVLLSVFLSILMFLYTCVKLVRCRSSGHSNKISGKNLSKKKTSKIQ